MREILFLVVMLFSLNVSANCVVEPIKVQSEFKQGQASDQLATNITVTFQSERTHNVTDGATLLTDQMIDVAIAEAAKEADLLVMAYLPNEVGWRF